MGPYNSRGGGHGAGGGWFSYGAGPPAGGYGTPSRCTEGL